MKNIFLLPTDKPSKVYTYKYKLNLIYSPNPENKIKNTWNELKKNFGDSHKPQHIYITSNEEIKEGDWYFDGTDLVHKKTKYNDTLVDGNKDAKKIILTTDQDLIKDRVQAIDDDFLEWLIKNQSCDFVEYDKNYNRGNGKYYYKIIIPKEEPKVNLERLPFPELIKEFAEYYKNIPLIEESKQETLEEAAENHLQKWRLLNNINLSNVLRAEKCKNDFTAGAKWQMNKWLAQFREKGSVKYLGTFETEEEARDAYNASQNKNLHHLLDKDYELNIQFHEAIRESIFSFSVAVYDEKLTFEEWTKKHYGRHIKVSKYLFSEEEVIAILENFSSTFDLITITPKEWFEQFKKKVD